ncbi:hypothetical protein PMAYCL1PPCAC_19579 [Pristionchus mayeri]|uniref:Uncharacterized protein n=1 Tax=Pristionchus mayeri TaxID=1317129 RepID=A0AAN5CRS9_9BILA|nr:hypothetical protein PMAYCL1PPCAC_19579 [Pristionchus mayeri]
MFEESKSRPPNELIDSSINQAMTCGGMDETVPLFKNDQPKEIKEEPMEMKEEPIDEFTDIKQEEPVADLYCPSTGSSRPIETNRFRHVFNKKCYLCGKLTSIFRVIPDWGKTRANLLRKEKCSREEAKKLIASIYYYSETVETLSLLPKCL